MIDSCFVELTNKQYLHVRDDVFHLTPENDIKSAGFQEVCLHVAAAATAQAVQTAEEPYLFEVCVRSDEVLHVLHVVERKL